MKTKITIVDKLGKKEKVVELTKETRNLNHLQAQINYPSQTFKNKKAYDRKKHKQNFLKDF
jgi:hypothetical protein